MIQPNTLVMWRTTNCSAKQRFKGRSFLNKWTRTRKVFGGKRWVHPKFTRPYSHLRSSLHWCWSVFANLSSGIRRLGWKRKKWPHNSQDQLQQPPDWQSWRLFIYLLFSTITLDTSNIHGYSWFQLSLTMSIIWLFSYLCHNSGRFWFDPLWLKALEFSSFLSR